MSDLYSQAVTAYEAYQHTEAVRRDPWGYGFAVTIDPAIVGSTAIFGSANRCQYMRLKTGAIISKIGLYVNVQSGNLCVAAYKNSGSGRSATPSTRLATSGSVAVPAQGYAEFTFGSVVRVEPGDWLALSVDNTTAQFGAVGNLGGLSNVMAGEVAYQDTAFPCPSLAVAAGYGGRSVLLIGVP